MLGTRIPTPIFFFLILSISLIFRVTNLYLIEFKGDEALNLYLASQPLFGNPMPYGGTVSSIGTLNPPIFNYILFPLTLLSFDPKIISFLIGLLNSIAIALLFLIIKRFYNLYISFIATVLLALSPWAIIYSRKIWPQDFILPLLVPIFYSVHKIIKDNDSRYWIGYVSFSLFLMQLHQSGLFFVPLLTLFLLHSKVRINIRAILIGIVIGIIPLLPYLSFQISNNCPDCKSFVSAKETLSGRSHLIFARPLQIMSQGNFHFLLYDDMVTFADNFPVAFQARKVFYAEYLLLPIGIFLFWKKNKIFRSLVHTALALPIIYFALNIVPHMHYSIILTPFLFLFLGFAFYILIKSKSKLIKFSSFLILFFLISVSLIFNYSLFSLIERQKGLKGDYGAAFYVTEEKAKEKLSGFENDPFYNEMLLASYLPKEELYGHKPIGKMIYSYEKTKQNLDILEKRLQEVPVDPRIHNELIAYYSFNKPNEETINLLEQKTKDIKGYNVVFETIQKLYIEERGKK